MAEDREAAADAPIQPIRDVDGSRHHPEMERYVRVVPYGLPKTKAFIVELHVGVQSFRVNHVYEDEDSALWTRNMVCNALAALVTEFVSGNLRVVAETNDGTWVGSKTLQTLRLDREDDGKLTVVARWP